MPDKSNSLNIKISFKTLFKIAAFLLGIYFLYLLRGLGLVILTGVVIASVIEPAVKWFVKRNIPRVLSAILVYALIIGAVAGMFTFVIPPLLGEMVSAISSVPKYVKTIDIFTPINRSAYSGTKLLFPDIPSTISVGDIISNITDTISTFSGGMFDTVAGFFGGIISAVLMMVIAFYLSVREDGVGEFLSIVTPPEYERYVRGLWQRAENKIARWMQGQLALGLVVFIFIYIGLLIIGVKHPLLLALVAGVFELIPVIGMTISAIPAFFLGVLDGGIGVGLFILGLYFVVQQLEAHVVYPLVVKKLIGVPPLLVIISLVAGAELAGIVGALLAVPVSVALMEYIDDVERRKKDALVKE
ncbi:MAG: AI-2E family transporter [bacterium]